MPKKNQISNLGTDGFGRLVQIVDGVFYDGLGNKINLSQDTNSEGTQGPRGEDGVDGSQGTQGPRGEDGVDGSQGTQGTQGSQGFQGIQGATGPQGENGMGATGATGPTGPQGATGSAGPTSSYPGTTGSVAFWISTDTLGENNSNFFWNNTNNRLGIGTNTPGNPLHIYKYQNVESIANVNIAMNNNGVGTNAKLLYLGYSNNGPGGLLGNTGLLFQKSAGTNNIMEIRGTNEVINQNYPILIRSSFTSQFYLSTDSNIGIGTTTTTSTKLTVIGNGNTSATNGLVVHNSTGTNKGLSVRDDGFVEMSTNAAMTTQRVQIGPTGDEFSIYQGAAGLTRNYNGYFSKLAVVNSNTGGNASCGFHTQTAGGKNMWMGSTSNIYTANLFGGQANTGVLYYKCTDNVTARMKFAISNNTSVDQNQFEWHSALVASTSLDQGFGSTTPIMTLLGNGSLGIGTASPNASALLDVTSTTKGILFPRMTTTQKNAISSPAAGLVIYDTTLNKLCVYTTAWETITSS